MLFGLGANLWSQSAPICSPLLYHPTCASQREKSLFPFGSHPGPDQPYSIPRLADDGMPQLLFRNFHDGTATFVSGGTSKREVDGLYVDQYVRYLSDPYFSVRIYPHSCILDALSGGHRPFAARSCDLSDTINNECFCSCTARLLAHQSAEALHMLHSLIADNQCEARAEPDDEAGRVGGGGGFAPRLLPAVRLRQELRRAPSALQKAIGCTLMRRLSLSEHRY